MDTDKETPKLYQADLLSLPEEVLYRCIFPDLQYGDLLRLRRVCKPIKVYADDFIRNNFTSQVREINETNYTLEHFLQTNLPTCSIYINNSSPAFFEDPLIPSFLNLCGNQITHVRIHHFATFISEQELHFFSSLANLLHLDLDFIDASKRDCFSTYQDANDQEVRNFKSPFPPNFKNLRTLKLNEIQGSRKDDLFYAWDIIDSSDHLEYVKHALYKVKDPYGVTDHPRGQFACVTRYIKRRHENNPNQPNLKFYDLEHYDHGNDSQGNRFPYLSTLCDVRGVKLLNVHSNLLNCESMIETSPIVSLRHVQGFTFMSELKSLEKLVIDSTERDGFEEAWLTDAAEIIRREAGDEDIEDPPKWPNLKILDLKIDSGMMAGDRQTPCAAVEDFLDFLFAPAPGKRRENLRELAIRYSLDKVFFKCIGHVPIPNVRHVTAMCPFVTKLTLQGWMGLNKHVLRFWEGLPLLEEVELDECIKLADVAFVGTVREDPVFLKLNHLRKLSLKRMDLMHKITDLGFHEVFRHLKVKEFCLTSAKPIQWISAKGIESLLTGNFNKYVEKFSFDGWSIDGVSEEAFKELKMKFRATHMI